MIVVTGAAGFIGSCLVWQLNQAGHQDLILVDELGHGDKWKNLYGKAFLDYYEKDAFLALVETGKLPQEVTAIFHLGACSSTTETNASFLIENNFTYSKKLAEFAFRNGIYFAYASSAATYGDGQAGYLDKEESLDELRPLNMYGYSKHLFDLWLRNNRHLDQVVGWKYFNVFGPNEYHKGEMRSVVCKAYEQISRTGKIELFKSYRPEYAAGEQKRDFVYVKDVCRLMYEFFEKKKVRGIFNVGMGKAHTWNELAAAVFAAMGRKPEITYVDMPEAIREKYQYFTEADMNKVRRAGLTTPFTPLAEAVADYVQLYLAKEALVL